MPTPKSLIRPLGYICAAVFVAYLAFLVVTIFFASAQTTYSKKIESMETRVRALETKYYKALSELSTEDVVSVGLVTPSDVRYVAKDGAPTVSRAGQ